MHQLESHLSYRIGLRTFSAMESRGVLGVPDAYELPSAAGQRLPQDRLDDADPVQGRLRVRAPTGTAGGTWSRRVVAGQIVPYDDRLRRRRAEPAQLAGGTGPRAMRTPAPC